MSDQDENSNATTNAAPQAGVDDQQVKSEAKPPWASEDDFSPQKAWSLIQNLRGDLDKAKSVQAEFEDREKTEAQRLSEAAESHKSRAEKAESELIRLQVGIEKGLTPAQAKRLVGSTKEDLAADADDLLASFGGKSNSTKPTERLRGGGEPDTEPEPDLRKIAADIPRR